jgi:hypothetical protein
MTVAADHQGFAALGSHDLRPRGRRFSGPIEVGQLADMVDLHIVRLLAELASARPEPFDQR